MKTAVAAWKSQHTSVTCLWKIAIGHNNLPHSFVIGFPFIKSHNYIKYLKRERKKQYELSISF